MKAFTHDHETVTLTWAEMLAFGGIVISETHKEPRNLVSGKLESVRYPMGSAAAGYVFCLATSMWRNLEDPG